MKREQISTFMTKADNNKLGEKNMKHTNIQSYFFKENYKMCKTLADLIKQNKGKENINKFNQA